ncbi:hypothetical protein DERP_013315 [Dermatophagoides pteronyssinus]|uniref:Uncharacterized protein n=1 Tax=Dermatophagoides pteronyssinus TaxID=6956 RepID=A0ABQ8J3N4_DERPT|nr:hypothetical protein DERP_013315 [Dermatophagoides pteronyssinus]
MFSKSSFSQKKNTQLFSMVGSYESTNCPSTNCIVNDDLPTERNPIKAIFPANQPTTTVDRLKNQNRNENRDQRKKDHFNQSINYRLLLLFEQ